jgi:hypothetical protein
VSHLFIETLVCVGLFDPVKLFFLGQNIMHPPGHFSFWRCLCKLSVTVSPFPLKGVLMKTFVTILSSVSISLSAMAAPSAPSNQAMIQNLSSCEQEIVAGMDHTRKMVWLQGASSVALGTMAGFATFGTGFMIESSASSSDIVVGGAVAEPGSTGLIISAVGTGVVIAALALGANYVDYRQAVDREESLLQLFKDVRNNGMGPQIDVRVAALQTTLKKLKAKADKKLRQTTGKDFNEQALADDPVRAAVMAVVSQLSSSKVASCENAKDVSQRIDKVALQMLVEKFNPSLRASVK